VRELHVGMGFDIALQFGPIAMIVPHFSVHPRSLYLE
jgi:hypothetical protein